MLGSHNSLSYLPCRKWWMYLINFAAKCQSKTLAEQYHAGVTYFDFRVRFDKNNNPVIAHGLVEYKGDIEHYVATLNQLVKHFSKEPVYVRFVLEFNKEPEDLVRQKNLLNALVSKFRGEYPYLTYDYTMTKWNEKDLIRYNPKMIYLIHKYSSTLGWKRFLWIPYLYARLHNKKNKKKLPTLLEDKEHYVVMLDFI